MGMMTRRNVKARGAKAPQPVPEVKASSFEEKVKASGLMKTEINRMTVAELQEIAKSFGVDGYAEMSGSQIKRLFIAALED